MGAVFFLCTTLKIRFNVRVLNMDNFVHIGLSPIIHPLQAITRTILLRESQNRMSTFGFND